MSPLLVALLAVLLMHGVKLFTFGYLYRRERSRSIGLWGVGSLLLLAWMACAAVIHAAGWPAAAEAWAIPLLVSAVACFSEGAAGLLGGRVMRPLLIGLITSGAWAPLACALGLPLWAATLPAGILIPVTVLSAGVPLLRSDRGLGAHLAGGALVLWGLHFADYPLLRELPWAAPLGFLLAGALDMSMAVGVLILHLDLRRNDEVKLQARLADAERLESIGRVTGGIAHDFNNLLTVIGAGLDATSGNEPNPEQQRTLTAAARAAANQAGTLTTQLLAFSRRRPLDPQPTDVGETVAQMTGILRALLGEKVSLRIVSSNAPVVVRIDVGQLQQIILNLVLNAYEATPGDGEVVVTSSSRPTDSAAESAAAGREAQSTAVLEVTDSGVGMSADALAHAVEPFYSGKNSPDGTGLGLSTVHGIVAAAGGELEFDSQVGSGTTARVLLPASSAVPSAPSVAAPTPCPRATSKCSALVVDDNPLVRSVAAMVLKRYGCQVLTAADAKSALALLEESAEQIHVLVTDVVMPGIDGVELARRVRERYPTVGVVLVSGNPDRIASAGEPVSPVDQFLAKPFTPDELLAAVDLVCEAAMQGTKICAEPC